MSYVVYHKTLSPEYLIEEKDYIQYLLTGEWFDRPQTNNEGNRDETERLLGESKRGKLKAEPELQRLQHDGREVLRDSDAPQREVEAIKSDEKRSPESNEKEILEVKKRGRPKKDTVNGEPNN